MAAVQLIERVDLSASLWLTFWNLETKRQVSLEIARPTYTYRIGQLYRFDSDEKNERAVLRPIADRRELGDLQLLVEPSRHPRSNFEDGETEQDRESAHPITRIVGTHAKTSVSAGMRQGKLRSAS